MYAITGANGFIGKHLTSYFRERDIPYRSIGRDSKNVDFKIKELSRDTNWEEAFEGVEVIFHLAAKVHEINNSKNNDLSLYLKNNFEATKKLISDACKVGVKKIIFLSTIKVNGEKTEFGFPFNFESSPNPQNAYAISKYKAEKILIKYGLERNIDFTIVRVPLVYGPGVKANFYTLLNLIYRQVPLPLGNINNKRSYIYVENLVDFLFICAKNINSSGKTFILSDPIPLSTTRLIKEIAYAFNKKVFLLSINLRLLKVIAFIFNKLQLINKLTNSLELDSKYTYETLNWNPPFSHTIALKKTANWFLKNIR